MSVRNRLQIFWHLMHACWSLFSIRATQKVFSKFPSGCDPKRHAIKICERSTLCRGEWDTRDTWWALVGLGTPATITAPGSVAYLSPHLSSRDFTSPEGRHLSFVGELSRSATPLVPLPTPSILHAGLCHLRRPSSTSSPPRLSKGFPRWGLHPRGQSQEDATD